MTACYYTVANLYITVVLKRLMSQTPYLIKQTAIAPYITGSGVLLESDGLRGCPLNWNETTR